MRVFSFLIVLFFLSPTSWGQLQPWGLQSEYVTAIAAEQGDPGESWFAFTANMLFAATDAGEVRQGRTWDEGKQWIPIGPFALPARDITALAVQHWGAGPRDGLHVLAALRYRNNSTGYPILVRQTVPMTSVPDSLWESADSGLVRDSAAAVRAIASYYFTGHTPPQPVLAWTGTGPWRGTPAGVFWESMPSPSSIVFAMDVTPKWFGSDVWAAGQTDPGHGTATAFRSSDQGATWKATTIDDNQFVPARAIAVVPGHPDTAFAAVNGTQYRTTDGGAHWISALWLPGANVVALACDPGNPATVFLAGDGGFLLFRSDDYGETWKRIAPAPDQQPAAITCMTVALMDTVPMGRPARRGLFLGTAGTGVWVYDIDGKQTGVEVSPVAASPRLVLHPNPANGAVTVEMGLPSALDVTIEIHDMLGRLVRRSAYGVRGVGVHSFVLPTDALSPGIYFLRAPGSHAMLRVVR